MKYAFTATTLSPDNEMLKSILLKRLTFLG